MFKHKEIIFVIALSVMLIVIQQIAKAEIISGLDKDTVTVRIFGAQLNTTNALNLKISFTNGEAVELSSDSPVFQANGATQLLASSDPSTGIVTVVWDGYIPSDEAKISFMLEPGPNMGVSTVLVDRIESAYGIDITNNVAIVLDSSTIVNSYGSEATSLGEFTLLDPGELYTPGIAAIAFEAKNIPSNLTAKLNGSPVTFLENGRGVAEVSLPDNANDLSFILEANSGNQKRFVNLGKIKLTKASTRLYPPIIDRAYVYNGVNGNRLKVYGRHFGVGRFGKEKVNVEIVPGNSEVSNNNLRRRSAKDELENISCIPLGSYINLSHPAGTVTKKINILGRCNP